MSIVLIKRIKKEKTYKTVIEVVREAFVLKPLAATFQVFVPASSFLPSAGKISIVRILGREGKIDGMSRPDLSRLKLKAVPNVFT